MHKLFFHPPRRYSEDIDLVQLDPQPIGAVFNAIREALGPVLGEPQRKQGPGVVTLTYRMQSETPPVVPLRIKIEINTREHFTVFGVNRVPFLMASPWWSGTCDVPTYTLEELLGTKMRALYQRRKFVCPPKAISITPPGPDGPPADRRNAEKMPREFKINMLRCIFCGLCEEVCPEEAIFLKRDYALVGTNRQEMVYARDKLLELGGTHQDSIRKWERKERGEATAGWVPDTAQPCVAPSRSRQPITR